MIDSIRKVWTDVVPQCQLKNQPDNLHAKEPIISSAVLGSPRVNVRRLDNRSPGCACTEEYEQYLATRRITTAEYLIGRLGGDRGERSPNTNCFSREEPPSLTFPLGPHQT